MSRTATRTQLVIANVALVLIVLFALAGLALHGLSAETKTRVWQSLLERPGGPMTFRFILQPVMAAVMAAIDGIKDARTGSSPYFSALITDPAQRGERLHEGLVSTSRILILGLVMDIAYQLIVLDGFFPGEAAIIAVLLAFIPYLVLRGPVARVFKWWLGKASA